MNKYVTAMFVMALCFIATIPSFPQQQKKKTIAVLEFNSGDLQKKELNILTNRFRSILVKMQVFDVLERDKMAVILKEQDFTMTDNCNSAECAVQVGQLLGMELMVAGDVGLLGSTYSVDLRLIDVSTGKIIQTETQDYEGKIDGLLGAMTTIANTFAGVKSSVSDNTKGTVVTQSSSDSFTDPRDGKVYKTVKIGNQVWMAENLNYDAGNGSWCYDKNSSNCDKYGRLYDWETAKRVAPAGWHLPSDEEWITLMTYLGGKNVAGGKLKEAGTTHWQGPNTGATNETGFTAFPGGNLFHNGKFYLIGSNGYWWSSTEDDATFAWYRGMDFYSVNVSRDYLNKTCGLSVRCVRDN